VSACSTQTAAPCLPPAETLEPAPALAPVVPDQSNGGVSERKVLQTLTDDDAAYNTLAARHNALSAHVKKFCQ